MEKFNIRLLRETVQTIDHHLRKMGEQFQKNHSRVAGGQVCPTGTGLHNTTLRFCDEPMEIAVIQVGRW
jgi:hypothetical protein